MRFGFDAGQGQKVLLAYFSRAGENYHYGGRTYLEVGNTEVAAEMISSSISADVYKIEAADPYPASYQATVERNVREQNEESRPEIAGQLPDVAAYDTVLLGSPIWNVRPPMIMRTFVERIDWSGKTVLPFVTYAVSGLGGTIDVTRGCAQDRQSTKASRCVVRRSATHVPMSSPGCGTRSSSPAENNCPGAEHQWFCDER